MFQFIFLSPAQIAESVYEINVFEQIVDSKGIVLFVLLTLIAMSVFCWFIIGFKWFFFRKIRQETENFLETFWHGESLDSIYAKSEELSKSPVARLFRAAYIELTRVKQTTDRTAQKPSSISTSYGFENIERTLRKAEAAETGRLEKLVPFLATTGSTAPFIGLFGTVWGIMKAFAYISPDRPILETVTPHIAQALVATAIGLLAAVPAVMAYNYFLSKIKIFQIEMSNFSIDFLNILKRHFFRE
jgi:biopolymer transport protein TolQ